MTSPPATLPPWAEGPFELIFHAELHFRAGEDFDRRIALVGYDNAIEVAITAYLSLHPLQRRNRSYPKDDVSKWLHDYHTKIDFFLYEECPFRKVVIQVEKSHIIWYHDIRNNQYHEGTPTIPTRDALRGVRQVALWVFSVLYDIADVEAILDQRIVALTPNLPPQREDRLDRVIDDTHGLLEIAGNLYYASEVLFGLDPDLYREMGLELLNSSVGDSVEAT